MRGKLYWVFTALLFSALASGKTQLLIATEKTLPNEFSKNLMLNKNYVSLIDYQKINTGVLSREELEQVDTFLKENHSITPQEQPSLQKLVTTIAHGYLSPLKKSVLKKLVKLADPEIIVDWEMSNLAPPAKVNPSKKHLTLASNRADDFVAINGIPIQRHDFEKISFNPNYYYHLTYLSNAYEASFQWARGDQIQNIMVTPIIEGSCQNPQIKDAFVSSIETYVLFPHGCTYRWIHPSDLTADADLNGHLTTTRPDNRALGEHWRPWVIGGLVVTGVILNEVSKNYDVQFKWAF